MIDDGRREEIRNRIDLVELCRDLGLDPKGKVARCPAHNDQGSPNLHIYPDHVFCFRCQWHADAFDLIAKVKGCDFPAAFDFLAARLGLPLIQDLRKSGRGLGNTAGGKVGDAYPKPAPLPTTPSPTLTTTSASVAGAVTVDSDSETTPAAGMKPALPVAMWRKFTDFGDAWSYMQSLSGYRRTLGREGDCYFVRAACGLATSRRSLRADAFAALLAAAAPAAETPAGAWLHSEKGIEPATQERFGLRFLGDPRAAAGKLVKEFGLDILLDVGIYGKDKNGKPYFGFKTHRLLFPFYWKGEAIDVQGRDVEATDKNRRFRNTGGKNPIPYNADALLEASETGAPVFLCEGATDTLALAQSGRLAVGIVGTGGFKSAWLDAFEGLEVFLAVDGDEAGRKAAQNVTKVFVDAGHRAPKVVTLPEGIKDINQFFRSMVQ